MRKRETSSRKDGTQTYQRILNTAGRLFAANGLAATTSKSIAAEAEADLALINYHFGSREGLYQQALKFAHAHIFTLEQLTAITQQADCPEAKLKGVIDLLTKAVLSKAEDDWHFKLLAREVLSPTPSLKVLWNEEGLPKIDVIKSIVCEITGLPPQSPAFFSSVICVVAPCLMMLVAGTNIPGPIQEVRTLSADDLGNYLYHFMLGGLNSIGEPRQPGG